MKIKDLVRCINRMDIIRNKSMYEYYKQTDICIANKLIVISKEAVCLKIKLSEFDINTDSGLTELFEKQWELFLDFKKTMNESKVSKNYLDMGVCE